MSKPIIRVHDILSDTITDREMTDEEFAQYEADQVADAARKIVEAEAKAAEEAAKQQAFNDAVATAVAAALAAQQEPVVTEE